MNMVYLEEVHAYNVFNVVVSKSFVTHGHTAGLLIIGFKGQQ
jgi:hypothetical protein